MGLERHLGGCFHCHDRLSGLRELLEPNSQEIQEAFPEPTREEIEETLALIARASNRKTTKRSAGIWYRALAIAAAILFLVGLGSFTLSHFIQNRKADAFLAEGRLVLEQVYRAQSPSGLRLDLPFRNRATQRESLNEERLHDAENLFYQAIAVKEELREAHLGLGYIYLSKRQFSKARQQFQTLLNSRGNDYQALLGRGVTLFEEGASLEDPLNRKSRVEVALVDFENVLKEIPASNEALHDKILTLHALGRHKEASQEIEKYLSVDGQSIWAERLRSLQARILN